MKKIVSLDPGHSWMKASDGIQPPLCFEAMYKETVADRPGAVRVKGQHYLVGDRAATAYKGAQERPYVMPGYHGSTAQYIHICYALERLQASGDYDLLVQSLPYTDHRDKALRATIRKLKTFEWSVLVDGTWVDRQVRFAEVATIPQGVGALEVYHQGHHDKPRIVSLVDIGACTLDLVTICLDGRGEYDYNYEACRSVENCNVSTFKDLWVEEIVAQVRGIPRGMRFDYFRLMDMAITKNFDLQYGDKVENIYPEFQAAKRRFRAMVKAAVQESLGDLEPNRIILTGGGAHLVDVEDWGDARLTMLDIWANVLGQLKVAPSLVALPPIQAPAPARAASAAVEVSA